MKTNIVETGTVIHTEGGIARVRLGKGTSCKGCGMAKLGLCRPGGAGMLLEVENSVNARVGDVVTIGLKRETHIKGYFLAFILPLSMLVVSTIAGYVLAVYMGLKGAEVIAGFLGLAITLFFSLRRLNEMDRSERMYIKRIIKDVPDFSGEVNIGAEGGDYLKGFQDISEHSSN